MIDCIFFVIIINTRVNLLVYNYLCSNENNCKKNGWLTSLFIIFLDFVRLPSKKVALNL